MIPRIWPQDLKLNLGGFYNLFVLIMAKQRAWLWSLRDKMSMYSVLYYRRLRYVCNKTFVRPFFKPATYRPIKNKVQVISKHVFHMTVRKLVDTTNKKSPLRDSAFAQAGLLQVGHCTKYRRMRSNKSWNVLVVHWCFKVIRGVSTLMILASKYLSIG